MSRDDSHVPPEALHGLVGRLAALEAAGGLAADAIALSRRARERVERDLLPRLSGARPELVVGVVGPNNAGKSTLVNALAGRVVTAVRPTGGATRRLVGAASAATRARLVAGGRAAVLGPFAPFAFDPERDGVELALEPGAPSELPVAEARALADGVLVVDSPDFDSARGGHRAASEALSLVSDVAVVVVTKSSYLNAEVVAFLETWLAGARPWVLVVNQSLGADTSRRQADELVRRVGVAPLAMFHAPLDVALQEGSGALALESLRAGVGDLASLFADGARRAEIVEAARRASMAGLAADLRALSASLRGRAATSEALSRVARSHTDAGARRVAHGLLPAAPLAAAFRTVLDRRGGKVQRGLREGARVIGRAVVDMPRLVGLGKRRAPSGPPDVASLEAERLAAGWLGYYEPLARDLGSERRAKEAREAPEDLSGALARDLDRAAWTVRDEALRRLERTPLGFDDFQSACERLIEDELERRGDFVLQSIATLSALAPAGAAATAIVLTGGVGADWAFAGGGAASYALYDWWVERAGAGLMERARAAWEEPRAAVLSALLFDASLPTAGPTLAAAHDAGTAAADELAAFAKEHLSR